MSDFRNTKRLNHSEINDLISYPISEGQTYFAKDTGVFFKDINGQRFALANILKVDDLNFDDYNTTDQKKLLNSIIISKDTSNNTFEIYYAKEDGTVIPLTSSTLANETWVNTYFISKTSIVDNLTTNDATKVLSAKQGKVLQDKKVDKTTTIIGLDLQDNILIGEFRTALGNATQSVAGLLSAADKTHLDSLVALLETSDSNNVVDTIGEILAIFNNYPEGADLVTALQGKVDKVVGKGLSENDLTDTLKSNYDTAYGWGNHASVGYITSNGISGMTSGQVAIAGSGSTITGSRAIDATSGGISGSTSLITSGAVFSGLATNYPEIIDLTGGL